LAQQIAEALGGDPGVTAVYLFGSTARGEATPHSDVDIAVLFAAAPPRSLNGSSLVLEGDLERALGRQVDLVVLNDAPVDLRIRILRDGQLLIDRDPAVRIAFEVRTRNEAFDLEAVLSRYRSPRAATKP
jgi:predicted nucleotidyltransferase